MNLSDIFSADQRNLLFEICKYLQYEDIKKLYLLNKSSASFVRDFISKNKNLLKGIINQRFIDRKFARIFKVKDSDHLMLGKNVLYYQDVNLWRSKLSGIDVGDLIFIESKNKYIAMTDRAHPDSFYIKPDACLPSIFDKPVFPISYWDPIIDNQPYRIWISCHTDSRDDLEQFKKQAGYTDAKNIILMDEVNPKSFTINCSPRSYFFN
jgi:hypothetical protein